ncbi:MAG: DsbA family protein [Rhodospirillales bacterium]|jgi:protein-disulfide isomerase|nr:DsbA family protein [Rhodospirillales bacterium]
MKKLAAFLVFFAVFSGLSGLGGPLAGQELAPVKDILADRVLGQAGAPVTIVEYASMACPHCASFHANQFPALKKEYIDTGKVKLIFREFPTSPQQLALAAAMLARCAPKERFFAIIKMLFRSQMQWGRSAKPVEALASIGQLAGVSRATFDACLKSKEIFQGLVKIARDGETKFSIQSTPSFIINGKKLEDGLSLPEFRKVINQALGVK